MTKLYEAVDHILIHTGYDDPILHRHKAAHIIISLGEKMCITSGNEEYFCYGVVIPEGIPHKVNTYGNAALVFLYDSTTDIAKQIRFIRLVSEECCRKIIASYTNFEQACTTDRYHRFESFVLTQLGFTDTDRCTRDERIISAIEYIHSMLSEQLSCKVVADAVHLSQSRFSHLFKSQMGMSFATYLVYRRIMYTYARILQGKSITEAALEAGFSSSSHFSDTNRRVFGLATTTITHDLKFIKVH